MSGRALLALGVAVVVGSGCLDFAGLRARLDELEGGEGEGEGEGEPGPEDWQCIVGCDDLAAVLEFRNLGLFGRADGSGDDVYLVDGTGGTIERFPGGVADEAPPLSCDGGGPSGGKGDVLGDGSARGVVPGGDGACAFDIAALRCTCSTGLTMNEPGVAFFVDDANRAFALAYPEGAELVLRLMAADDAGVAPLDIAIAPATSGYAGGDVRGRALNPGAADVDALLWTRPGNEDGAVWLGRVNVVAETVTLQRFVDGAGADFAVRGAVAAVVDGDAVRLVIAEDEPPVVRSYDVDVGAVRITGGAVLPNTAGLTFDPIDFTERAATSPAGDAFFIGRETLVVSVPGDDGDALTLPPSIPRFDDSFTHFVDDDDADLWAFGEGLAAYWRDASASGPTTVARDAALSGFSAGAVIGDSDALLVVASSSGAATRVTRDAADDSLVVAPAGTVPSGAVDLRFLPGTSTLHAVFVDPLAGGSLHVLTVDDDGNIVGDEPRVASLNDIATGGAQPVVAAQLFNGPTTDALLLVDEDGGVTKVARAFRLYGVDIDVDPPALVAPAGAAVALTVQNPGTAPLVNVFGGFAVVMGGRAAAVVDLQTVDDVPDDGDVAIVALGNVGSVVNAADQSGQATLAGGCFMVPALSVPSLVGFGVPGGGGLELRGAPRLRAQATFIDESVFAAGVGRLVSYVVGADGCPAEQLTQLGPTRSFFDIADVAFADGSAFVVDAAGAVWRLPP